MWTIVWQLLKYSLIKSDLRVLQKITNFLFFINHVHSSRFNIRNSLRACRLVCCDCSPLQYIFSFHLPAIMIIPVRPNTAGIQDWSAIELQGQLENRSDDSFAELALGRFKVDAKGRATIVIGSHRLEGKKVTLAKPLAVTTKERDGYSVIGLIKDKFVFKNRPHTQKMQLIA